MGTETKLHKEQLNDVQKHLHDARAMLPGAKLTNIQHHQPGMLGQGDHAPRLIAALTDGTGHVNAAIDNLDTGLGKYHQYLTDVAGGIEESSHQSAIDAKKLADGIALIGPPLYQQHDHRKKRS